MPVTHPRLVRELRTIRAMIQIYCQAEHSPVDGLCPSCEELYDYARGRLDRCPFQESKSTCANCTVHCYQPAMRARIRTVMRMAGPRMLYKHPYLAVMHLLDGRRKAPALRKRNA